MRPQRVSYVQLLLKFSSGKSIMVSEESHDGMMAFSSLGLGLGLGLGICLCLTTVTMTSMVRDRGKCTGRRLSSIKPSELWFALLGFSSSSHNRESTLFGV